MSEVFAKLTDVELVSALRDIDRMSPDIGDLLIEMWKRGLEDAEQYCVGLMNSNLQGHADIHLYDLSQILCGWFDGMTRANDWWQFVYGWEQRILDALMAISLKNNSRIWFEALELAAEDGDESVVNKAILSVAKCVPTNEPGLFNCLVKWIDCPAVYPKSKAALYNKLAELPWSEELEKFFVQQYIADDGSLQEVTEAINAALRR